MHDTILISKVKNSKDKISFSGRFKKGINKKSNTIIKVLNLLRKKRLLENQTFKINIQKNIPHGSGLGGGSSNATFMLVLLNNLFHLKLTKIQLLNYAKILGVEEYISADF